MTIEWWLGWGRISGGEYALVGMMAVWAAGLVWATVQTWRDSERKR